MIKLSSNCEHTWNLSVLRPFTLINRIQTAQSMKILPWRRAFHGTTIGYRLELKRRTISLHLNPRTIQIPYSHRLLRQRTRNSSTASHIRALEPASSASALSAAPATSALECSPTARINEMSINHPSPPPSPPLTCITAPCSQPRKIKSVFGISASAGRK